MQHKMQHKNKKSRSFGTFSMRLTGLEPKTMDFGEKLDFIAFGQKA